ncbi:methylenetetrahydrofolate reductase C-terminal domain-containing protein, partial [Clostridioides difficile]
MNKFCLKYNKQGIKRLNNYFPVTMCAKGLMNGACGGAKNGKCEVNSENDCAWIKIYERLEAI